MTRRVTLFTLLSILALGAFFRFYQIAEIPPGLYPDEAMNGNNALEALAGRDFKVFYPENNGREGLFINLQAASLRLFGSEPWALRVVSALFGTLTILGFYLVTRELFRELPAASMTALLSSFFLATSLWHINFSRIGFRAILLPFFASFGMYFLLKGLRRGKIVDIVLAGICIGLGFHTYLAFRVMPLVLAVPLGWWLWRWYQRNPEPARRCIPCAVLLFILVVFVTALPMGLYFLQNPEDLLGRTADVSIFTTESPLREFLKSTAATLGMLFWKGDCNWRHNLACEPELHPMVFLSFLVGVIALRRGARAPALSRLTVLSWFLLAMLPAILTREGLPHALRSIGMLPPIMILAGLGATRLIESALSWLEREKVMWPQYVGQLSRIGRETVILAILALLVVPVATYRNYFIRWASSPNTYFAFTTDIFHLGQFLNGLPPATKKYVIVNLAGVMVRGIPMPAQTVMFTTNTFREEMQKRTNITYLLPAELGRLAIGKDEKVVIAFLNGDDRPLIGSAQRRFPALKAKVPGDFVILQN